MFNNNLDFSPHLETGDVEPEPFPDVVEVRPTKRMRRTDPDGNYGALASTLEGSQAPKDLQKAGLFGQTGPAATKAHQPGILLATIGKAFTRYSVASI